MLKVVAAYADTWNTSVTVGMGRRASDLSPNEAQENIRRRNAMLDDACAAIGRDPGGVRRSLLAGGGSSPENPWASVEAFQDFVGRYHEAGVDEFLFYYPSRAELAPGHFERIAREVIPALKRGTVAA